MADPTSLSIVVQGLVQGVGFRYFVLRCAKELDLTGYARNMPGGTVEVKAEGERDKLNQLIAYLKTGPRMSEVNRIDISWSDARAVFPTFEVIL